MFIQVSVFDRFACFNVTERGRRRSGSVAGEEYFQSLAGAAAYPGRVRAGAPGMGRGVRRVRRKQGRCVPYLAYTHI
eukprot:9063331-Pyramimonas_sp.AAC.1